MSEKKISGKKVSAGKIKPIKGKKNGKYLVIVESPAKAQTIEKYLGSNFKVLASMGHLIDLPKSRMAINIENNFEPEYITVRGRAKVLKELKKEAKNSTVIFLASDNDREGEAIAFHLLTALKDGTSAEIKRIVFNEITPQAIKTAVEQPVPIDNGKVNAQKARRVLDRLVGYSLSPLLWEKVKNGLSAGRVQSVALRLLCEREKEVENFIPDEYWTLDGNFKYSKKTFEAQLVRYKDEKPLLKNADDVNKIIEKIIGLHGTILAVKTTDKTVRPKPPFTTSTLQQTAANRLGFTSRKTMQIAQQLYEGIQVGTSRIGLITYMRTDSVRISKLAIDSARKWLGENYPDDLPIQPPIYTAGSKTQDAHEAVRPTYIDYTPEYLSKFLNKDQLKLYSIIWERFIACQMKNAKTQTLTYEIAVGEAVFKASCTQIIENSFYKIMKILTSNEEKRGSAIPVMKEGDEVTAVKLQPEQHFTQGPARYTDASIVKMLEEKGIGRPSTYAPIITVLLDRYYVTRANKQLVPTHLGKVINKLLIENFSDIVDVNFTAGMENNLDSIEEKDTEWTDLIRGVYEPFRTNVEEAMKNVSSIKGSLDEFTDIVCDKCGKKMIKKLGRFGVFLACSGFPECRNTKSIPLAKCPVEGCGGDIVSRKGKGKRREFYGCTNYPECGFISHFKPINAACPKCGWFMVEKYDKKHGNYKACINPKCDYLHSIVEGVEDMEIERADE